MEKDCFRGTRWIKPLHSSSFERSGNEPACGRQGCKKTSPEALSVDCIYPRIRPRLSVAVTSLPAAGWDARK